MAYFLKRTNTKKGTYLQIYFSYWDPITKKTRNKSVKALGYIDDLIAAGMPDPVSYFRRLVEKLNDEYRAQIVEEETEKIGETTALKYFGHFPILSILRRLKIADRIDSLGRARSAGYSLFDCLCSLVTVFLADSEGKADTIHTLMEPFFEVSDLTEDQILDALDILGNSYLTVVRLLSAQMIRVFHPDLSTLHYRSLEQYYYDSETEQVKRQMIRWISTQDGVPAGMRLHPITFPASKALKEMKDDLGRKTRVDRIIWTACNRTRWKEHFVGAIENKDDFLVIRDLHKCSEEERQEYLEQSDISSYNCLEKRKGRAPYDSSEIEVTYTFWNKKGKETAVDIIERRFLIFNIEAEIKHVHEILELLEQKREDEDPNLQIQPILEGCIPFCGYSWIKTSAVDLNPASFPKINADQSYEDMLFLEGYWDIAQSLSPSQQCSYDRGWILVEYISLLVLRLLKTEVFENKFTEAQIRDFMWELSLVQTDFSRFGPGYRNCSASSDMADFLAEKYGLPVDEDMLNGEQMKRIMNAEL